MFNILLSNYDIMMPMKQQFRNDMNPFDGVVPDYSTVLADHYSMGPKYHIHREQGRQDYLLMLTLKGSGFINLNESHICTEPGILTVHHPHVFQDYGTRLQHTHWEFLWIHCLPPPPVAALLHFPDVQNGLGILDLKQLPSIERRRVVALFNDAVLWALKTRPLDRQMAMNLLENLLLRVHNSLFSERSAFVETIHTYILQHLADDLSAEKLAKVVHLSASWFAHRFKEDAKMSPQIYVERVRMEYARRRIENGDLSIKEAAALVGFPNQRYFATRFRHTFGHTPSTSRRSS